MVLRGPLHRSSAERNGPGHRAAPSAQLVGGQEPPHEAWLCLRHALLHRPGLQHDLLPRGHDVRGRYHPRHRRVEGQCGNRRGLQCDCRPLHHVLCLGAEQGRARRKEEDDDGLPFGFQGQHAEGFVALQGPDLRADLVPGCTRHGALDRLPLLHAVAGARVLHTWRGCPHLLGFRSGTRLLKPAQRHAVKLHGEALPGPRPPDARQLLGGHRHPLPGPRLLHPSEASGPWRGRQPGAGVHRVLPDVRLGCRDVRHHQQEGLVGHRAVVDLHLRLRHGPAHREQHRQPRGPCCGHLDRQGLPLRQGRSGGWTLQSC
mmetsp:Transcript_128620/g.411265  ORF Transcript_128620/g.411265 Transcript_128620/m.411265 type:complete len:316 (+) Transcript_128620:456-1403(+)